MELYAWVKAVGGVGFTTVGSICQPSASNDTLAGSGSKNSFAEQVAAARREEPEVRRSRLLGTDAVPTFTVTTTVVFNRNPYVVAEVLARAAGKCEACDNPAPFVRSSDGTPYLEVHHRERLADGGLDTVKNAVALCPNCHRKAHYGRDNG
jgi:5-methylcytosine-specific restriction protein A